MDPKNRLIKTDTCLFQTGADGGEGVAGPWLVQLGPDAPFCARLFTLSKAHWHLWARGRPILIRTALSLADLRQHLRRFIRMRLENGAMPFFRFWDAAILSDYFEGCAALPERAARLFGCAPDGTPLIQQFWLKSEDDADQLISFRVAGPLRGLPGQTFDATDLAILQAGVDRRLIRKLTPRLEQRFAKLAPNHVDKAKPYATGALSFIRKYGGGQSHNLERDCFELALVAFLLGPSWVTVRKGPLLTNRMIPMSQRVALLRESYFAALKKVPPPQET